MKIILKMMSNLKSRCFGEGPGKEFYADYHDYEWGIPSYDDGYLFEMLILEGAQAGLNWETILKKREGYRKAFHDFNPSKVAAMSDETLDLICKNPAVIRHPQKIDATRKNAGVYLKIQKEFGSFSQYIWAFVDNKPIRNHWNFLKEIPRNTPESDRISKDLKKRGMIFVGPTTIYAYMQAIGIVNDHIKRCWRYSV